MKAIAAMSLNRVIGSGGKIPWHIPDELRWFKQTTMGGTLVMGRKTFESIGKALPGRQTVVVSRGGFFHPDVRVVRDLVETGFRAGAMPDSGEIFVVGGAEIYAQTLHLCSELLLSVVQREVDGDVLFPPFEHLFENPVKIHGHPEFVVSRWMRKAGGTP